MQTTTFMVQGTPIPKGNLKAFPILTGDRRWIKNRVTDSGGKKLKAWQSLVAFKAKECFDAPFETPVYLTITFYFNHPKYHYTPSGNKSKRYTTFHVVKPDIDKLQRAVLDALTGIAYVDDAQVIGVHTSKNYSTFAGAEISVTTLSSDCKTAK